MLKFFYFCIFRCSSTNQTWFPRPFKKNNRKMDMIYLSANQMLEMVYVSTNQIQNHGKMMIERTMASWNIQPSNQIQRCTLLTNQDWGWLILWTNLISSKMFCANNSTILTTHGANVCNKKEQENVKQFSLNQLTTTTYRDVSCLLYTSDAADE